MDHFLKGHFWVVSSFPLYASLSLRFCSQTKTPTSSTKQNTLYIMMLLYQVVFAQKLFQEEVSVFIKASQITAQFWNWHTKDKRLLNDAKIKASGREFSVNIQRTKKADQLWHTVRPSHHRQSAKVRRLLPTIVSGCRPSGYSKVSLIIWIQLGAFMHVYWCTGMCANDKSSVEGGIFGWMLIMFTAWPCA